jgi:rhodanese-related sulfurtransferase
LNPHIANATNSNWLGNSFSVDANLDKNKPVFVYCKSGIGGKAKKARRIRF